MQFPVELVTSRARGSMRQDPVDEHLVILAIVIPLMSADQ